MQSRGGPGDGCVALLAGGVDRRPAHHDFDLGRPLGGAVLGVKYLSHEIRAAFDLVYSPFSALAQQRFRGDSFTIVVDVFAHFSLRCLQAQPL